MIVLVSWQSVLGIESCLALHRKVKPGRLRFILRQTSVSRSFHESSLMNKLKICMIMYILASI